jgi:hypothetical protein
MARPMNSLLGGLDPVHLVLDLLQDPPLSFLLLLNLLLT